MEEEDLVLCTVDRITNTTIFVKLPDGKEATIISSEIAPGRIKNMRVYVSPNKKIVCKVLRIQKDHIDLSLRRVSSKEKKQVLDSYEYEKTILTAFNQILKPDFEKVEENIKKDFSSILEFAEKAKNNELLIEKYIPPQHIGNIKKVLSKKQKEVEVKKIIKLKCLEKDGLLRIKRILTLEDKNQKITYIAAGKFQISLKAEDYKKANQQMEEILTNIKNTAKLQNCEFEVEDKK